MATIIILPIYEIKGLYEYLFYERYKCDSLKIVSELLKKPLEQESHGYEKLLALDIGAGNGIVGEKLDALGAEMLYDTAAQYVEII